jgi:hypothetical protein
LQRITAHIQKFSQAGIANSVKYSFYDLPLRNEEGWSRSKNTMHLKKLTQYRKKVHKTLLYVVK